MKLVIIAAGEGTRIRSLSRGIPKTLLKINRRCIIDVLLDNCTEAGIREGVVVTGYRDDLVRNHLRKARQDITLQVVYNPDWKQPNGGSVLAAKSTISPGENFLISMSDHLYGPQLLRKISASHLNANTVNVGLDFNLDRIFNIEDGMKVKVDPADPGVVTAMSKNLANYDAIDCGVFKCRYDFFRILEQAHQSGAFSLAEACNRLFKEHKLGGVDIEDAFWLDIDTPEALKYGQANSAVAELP